MNSTGPSLGPGLGKRETPQDIIEIDIATVGAAYPTEIGKPVAVADVAGASGPAVTGAGGPVMSRNAVPGQLLMLPEPVARQ